MERAGADLGVQRLHQHAALLRPVAVEGLDHVLECAVADMDWPR